MSNSISLRIGDRDPYAYLQKLHSELRGLYDTSKAKGWISAFNGPCDKDYDMMVFMLYFFLNASRQSQRPTEAPYTEGKCQYLTIDIGDANPRWYRRNLTNYTRTLFTLALHHKWIGTESERDNETYRTILDFLYRIGRPEPKNNPQGK